MTWWLTLNYATALYLVLYVQENGLHKLFPIPFVQRKKLRQRETLRMNEWSDKAVSDLYLVTISVISDSDGRAVIEMPSDGIDCAPQIGSDARPTDPVQWKWSICPATDLYSNLFT